MFMMIIIFTISSACSVFVVYSTHIQCDVKVMWYNIIQSVTRAHQQYLTLCPGRFLYVLRRLLFASRYPINERRKDYGRHTGIFSSGIFFVLIADYVEQLRAFTMHDSVGQCWITRIEGNVLSTAVYTYETEGNYYFIDVCGISNRGVNDETFKKLHTSFRPLVVVIDQFTIVENSTFRFISVTVLYPAVRSYRVRCYFWCRIRK